MSCTVSALEMVGLLFWNICNPHHIVPHSETIETIGRTRAMPRANSVRGQQWRGGDVLAAVQGTTVQVESPGRLVYRGYKYGEFVCVSPSKNSARFTRRWRQPCKILWTAINVALLLFNSVRYVFLLLCMLCSVYSVFIVPTGIFRPPWLRVFRAFSSAVRQMPGYNSQRRGTARTVASYFVVLFCVLFVSIVLFYILFVCKCVL